MHLLIAVSVSLVVGVIFSEDIKVVAHKVVDWFKKVIS